MSQHAVRLSEAVESYLAYRSSRYAASTVTNEAFVMRRFVAWVGDIQLRHLRPEKVEEWFYGPGGLLSEHVTRDRIRREAIQPSTHNFYRTRLASLFRYCTQRGLIRTDLLMHVQPMKVERKQRQQPAAHLLLALLDAAESGRDRAYIATAINTGLRSNEITRLRVGDVDLRNGWLSVRITKSHDNDQQPITSDLDRELREWLTIYAIDLGRALVADDHLFPGRTGSRYRWETASDGTKVRTRQPSTWQPERPVAKTAQIVKSAMAAVGLPTKHEGTHTIRRAVARAFFDSMSDEVGYDAALRTVSALLHHKSSATTEHYLGLSSERKRRDERLRARPFLTAMVQSDNVIPLRASDGS